MHGVLAIMLHAKVGAAGTGVGAVEVHGEVAVLESDFPSSLLEKSEDS